jgi:hypothetical protein
MIVTVPKDISLKATASTRKHLEAFFGAAVPDNKLASLVGALDGSIIEIAPLGEGFISRARHQYLIEQIRIGGGGEAGLFLTNEFFQLTGDAPEGTGLISFIRQVTAARDLGFTFIRTYAEGSVSDPDGFIGYYVWARFGFNAPLEEHEIENLPPELGKCRDLNDLMMRGGQEWWRQNGSGRDMIFLLSDGELSLTVLGNYLADKEVEVEL